MAAMSAGIRTLPSPKAVDSLLEPLQTPGVIFNNGMSCFNRDADDVNIIEGGQRPGSG